MPVICASHRRDGFSSADLINRCDCRFGMAGGRHRLERDHANIWFGRSVFLFAQRRHRRRGCSYRFWRLLMRRRRRRAGGRDAFGVLGVSCATTPRCRNVPGSSAVSRAPNVRRAKPARRRSTCAISGSASAALSVRRQPNRPAPRGAVLDVSGATGSRAPGVPHATPTQCGVPRAAATC